MAFTYKSKFWNQKFAKNYFRRQKEKSFCKRLDLEVIKRPPRRFWIHQDTPLEELPKIDTGFKVQPKRWVVERAFAWLGRNRRLSKEYEFDTNSSENLIYMAMNRLIIRRKYV